MMKPEFDYDEFDNMFFDYYDNNKYVPTSTHEAIQNAFLVKRKKDAVKPIDILRKVAILIISLGIVTVSTVYAKDIINFITRIFTNSTPGIDKAVENGYVQNVDMDYIVCNDVGVKVDYILMDDHSLDISFVYKYFGETDYVENIAFNDLCIQDEQNNILFWLSKNSLTVNDNSIMKSINLCTNTHQNIDNSTIRNSLLLAFENSLNSKTLSIKVSSLTLKLGNESKNINGNWNFSINLDDKFVYKNESVYNYSDNPYVNNIKTTLSDSTLLIELDLNTLIDSKLFVKPEFITLTDENNTIYDYIDIKSQNVINNKPYKSIINLSYPISIYDNLNTLFLHIKLDTTRIIDIKLYK